MLVFRSAPSDRSLYGPSLADISKPRRCMYLRTFLGTPNHPGAPSLARNPTPRSRRATTIGSLRSDIAPRLHRDCGGVIWVPQP